MIKLFNDPNFLLEVFYAYNKEVDGTAEEDDKKRDKFNEISVLFREEYNIARKLQEEKASIITKKSNKVKWHQH
jgi:hypothetical protein